MSVYRGRVVITDSATTRARRLRPFLGIAIVALGLSGCFRSQAESDWRQARSTNTVSAYEAFLRDHPNEPQAVLAFQAVEAIHLQAKDRNEGLRVLEQWHLKQIEAGALAGRLVIHDVRPQSSTLATGTLTYTKGTDGKTTLAAEFPYDRMLLSVGGIALSSTSSLTMGDGDALQGSAGSIQRYVGTYRVDADGFERLVGEGERFERLSFTPVANLGYVYVRGRGKVVLADKTEIDLGFGSDNYTSLTALEGKQSDASKWPPAGLSEAPKDLPSAPESLVLDKLSPDKSNQDSVYTSATKVQKFSKGSGDTSYKWYASGELRLRRGLRDVGEPESCYSENAFELLYSGDSGLWLRLVPPGDRLASVQYLQIDFTNGLYQVEEMMLWCQGTRFRFRDRSYELRQDGWYDGARRVARFGKVLP